MSTFGQTMIVAAYRRPAAVLTTGTHAMAVRGRPTTARVPGNY